MVELTEEKIWEKYESLSPKIKEALDSSFVFNLIDQIAKKFFLNETDGEILKAYAGYVLLGFVPPYDLLKEITGAEAIDADEKILVEIIREINRKVFFPLHAELEKLYKLGTHIEETLELKPTQPIIEIKKETPKPVEPEKKIEIKTEIPKITKPIEEGKPFILHEEKSFGVAQDKPKVPLKPFSFPFKIFAAKPKTEEPPVKARVEEPKRIVHYSESRTPLEPFSKEEVINLETFQTEVEKPKPETKSEQKTETKSEENSPQPKLEGNVVDLR